MSDNRTPYQRQRRPLTENERREIEMQRRRQQVNNQRQRAYNARPSSGRTVSASQPQRAPVRQRAPQSNNKYSPKKKKKVKFTKNGILFIFLICLVIASVIIIKIQSGNTSADVSDSNKNPVKLTSETTAATDTDTEGLFAEYTEETVTLEGIESKYAILIDLDENRVIASKNGEERIYPASMTKMMTLIVAYENIKNLKDTYTYSSAILDPLYAQNASQAGFAPGEEVTLEDMLYGCVLPSGADATVGLAYYVAGGESEFAELMNDKAEALGLKNTHFVTVSGLHDNDHYSTCHEMAVILRYAISNPYLREILSTYQYTTSPTTQHPNGILLSSTMYSRMRGDEAEGVYIMGGKTGYTNEALNCLASFAANCSEELAPKAKPQYILVTASAAGEYTPVYDAFEAYEKYCQPE